MIRLAPVVTNYATLRGLALALLLAGCGGLPSYNTVLPPLPPSFLQADDTFVMADDARLPARTWLPEGRPRAVVVALHGFNDSRDAWELPGPEFAAAGIALFAPDQRGFGAAPRRGFWPGEAALVSDAAAMLRILHARYPGVPVYAMGESMGGAVLMALAASGQAPAVDGWVLLAPAVWGRAQMGAVLSSGLWLVSNVAPGLSVTGGEVPIRVIPSDNREALLRLARDPLTIRRTRFDALRGLTDLMDTAQMAAARLPDHTLALYGERDTLVPAEAAGRAWDAMPPGVRRGLYRSGYHLLMRDRARMAVIGDVIAWINAPDAWLPSGADVAAASWRSVHH
jgi:alpha-beta hydrolase superfamily lysophospholipase